MSDFTAKIIAQLDTSKVEGALKSLSNTSITLNNVKPNTSNLISQIQKALDGHTFSINIGNGIKTSALTSNMQKIGTNAGRVLSQGISDSITDVKLNTPIAKLERDSLKQSYDLLKANNEAKVKAKNEAYQQYKLADQRYTVAYKAEQKLLAKANETSLKQQLAEAQTAAKQRLVETQTAAKQQLLQAQTAAKTEQQIQKQRLTAAAKAEREMSKLGSSQGLLTGNISDIDNVKNQLKDRYSTGRMGYGNATVSAAGSIKAAGQEFQKFNVEVSRADGTVQGYTAHINTLTGEMYQLNKGVSENAKISYKASENLPAASASENLPAASASENLPAISDFRSSRNANNATMSDTAMFEEARRAAYQRAWQNTYGNSYNSTVDSTLANGGSFVDAFSNASYAVQAQKISDVGDALTQVTDSATKYVALPIAAATTMSIKAFTDYETAFAGVKKTVDGTDAELQVVSNGIEDLALRVPVASTELANIAMIGGQLGIPTSNLLQFAEAFAGLQTATNLQGEDGAATFARFMNVMGEDYDNIDKVGSTIVDLGNHTATTELEIANMATRMGSAGSIIGMSTADVLGYSAALSSLGVEAEMGGSAMTRIWQNIDTAVSEGGDSVAVFAEKSKMSADKFTKAWKSDPTQAFNALIKGLHDSDNIIGDLSDLSINNVRDIQSMEKLANGYDLVTDSLNRANSAYSEGTALQIEADKAYDTTASKLKITKEQITQAGRNIGEALSPTVQKLSEGISGAAKGFANLDEGTQENIASSALWTAGSIAAVNAAGKLTKTVGTVKTGIAALAGTMGVSVGTLGQAGLAIGGVTAAVILGKKAYDEWYKSRYLWADGLTENAQEFQEAAGKYTQLVNIRKQYNEAQKVLSNPTASTDEIDSAKSKIEEIKKLLEEEYNLKITSNSTDIDKVISSLSAQQRYDALQTASSGLEKARKQKDKYINAESELEDYDKQMADYQDKVAALEEIRSEAQALGQEYKDGAVSAEAYQKRMEELANEAFVNGGSGELFPSSDGQITMDTTSDIDALNKKMGKLSEKYGEALQQRQEWETYIEDAKGFSEILASDVQQGNDREVRYDETQFKELGRIAHEAGTNTDEISRSFAVAKTGYTDFRDAIDDGKVGEVTQNFIDYKKAIDDFNGSEESVISQAAMIKNGFSEMSPVVQQNQQAVQGIIADMKLLGDAEGLFNGLDNNGISEKLTEMAQSIGLIPDTKHISFDVDTGEATIIDDLAAKVKAITDNGNAEINLRVNGDGVELIDTTNAALQELITNGADIGINFNTDTGLFEIFNDAEKIGTITAEGRIEWVDTDPPQPDDATAEGTVNYSAGEVEKPEDATIDGVANYYLGEQPTKADPIDGVANYDMGTAPTWTDPIWGTANYEMGDAPTEAPPITGTATYHITYTYDNIAPAFNSLAKKAGGLGKVDGTAYSSGNAFAQGNWGTKSSGVALGGELGEELLVRNGKFFTIGSNSTEFFPYKKGDIIFNADQTKQIFDKGKITHGKRRGRAYHTGTAFADGNNKVQKFDWVETFGDRVKSNIEKFTNGFKNTYLTLVNRFSYLEDAINETRNQIDFKQQAYDRYIEEANSIGLDESWAAKIRDGEFDISSVTDDDLKEKINDYEDWYKKAIECKEAIDDLRKSVSELYEDNFDNIEKAYDHILTSIENKASNIDNYIDLAEEKGLLGSTRYYTSLQEIERKNLEQLQHKKSDLTNALNDAINRGDIELYSEAWYDLSNNIDEVTEAINKSKISLAKYSSEMREISWDRFDYLHDSISQFKDESDFLIELLDGDDLYEENGQLSNKGLATLGLYGLNYNTLMSQVSSYANEIAKINSELAENPGDDNLIQRKQKLLELQREAITTAKDEKESMVDLVKDGIEKETDALEDLIDKYTDSLDSAKDLYDYQSRINERTKDIATIEKQLAAYQNDTSEETKATVQKLKDDLKEAQQNLKDEEYDKYVDDQKELLNSLYDEYETLMNERLDNIDVSFADLIEKVNDNSSTISRTLSKEASSVGATLSNEMRIVWTSQNAALSKYLSTGGIVLNGVSGYFENTNNALTGVNTALNEIKQGVNSVVRYASYQAKVDIDPSGSQSQMIQNSLDWFATDDSSVKNSLSSENNLYGKALGYTKKDGTWYDSNNNVVYSISNDDKIRNIVSKMKANSSAWNNASDSERNRLAEANNAYADRIRSLTNEKVYRDGNGVWWIGNKQLYSYKTGGLADFTGAAWLDGSPSKPELVLNSQDTKNFIELKEVLNDMSKQGVSLRNMGYVGLNEAPRITEAIDMSSLLSSLSKNENMSVNKSIGDININIPIEHIDNYNDFVSQLQKDKQFERLVRSVSVDLLNGGSTLSKNKYKW